MLEETEKNYSIMKERFWYFSSIVIILKRQKFEADTLNPSVIDF